MPSENKTPNIGLNQWQGNEYVKREDFVNDNLIIDREIKDLQAKADEKVEKVSGKGLSTNDYTTEEKQKLSNIQAEANKYTHPSKHSLDIIIETSDKKIMTNAERDKLNSIENNANKYIHPATHSISKITETSTKKVMTSDERNKLSGIQSGAQVNRTISSSVSSTSTSTASSSKAVKTAYDKGNSAYSKVTSASYLRDKIKTVDGSGSEIDADKLDGQHGNYYLNYNNFSNRPPALVFVPGDYKIAYCGNNYSTSNTTYTKVFEFTTLLPGTIRVGFVLGSWGGTLNKALGRFYINGNPVGTERTYNGTSGYDYTYSSVYVEDIAVQYGDKIQFYLRYGGTSDKRAKMKDFKISIGESYLPIILGG